jgi:hypothetical protein
MSFVRTALEVGQGAHFGSNTMRILHRIGQDFADIILKLDSVHGDVGAAKIACYDHILDCVNVTGNLINAHAQPNVAIAIKLLWQDGQPLVRTLARNELFREPREQQCPPNYFSYLENTAFEVIGKSEPKDRYFASDHLSVLYAQRLYKNARDSWPTIYDATAVVGIPGAEPSDPLLGYLCADLPAGGRLTSFIVRRLLDEMARHLYYTFRLILALQALDSGELTRNRLGAFVSGNDPTRTSDRQPGFVWDGMRLAPSNLTRQLLLQSAISRVEDAHDERAWVSMGASRRTFMSSGEHRPVWRPGSEKMRRFRLALSPFGSIDLSLRGGPEMPNPSGLESRQQPRKESSMTVRNEANVVPPGSYEKSELPALSPAAQEIVDRVRARSARHAVAEGSEGGSTHLVRLPPADSSALTLADKP